MAHTHAIDRYACPARKLRRAWAGRGMLIYAESSMDSGHTTLATARLAEHTGTRGHEVTGHGGHNDSCGGQATRSRARAGEVVRMRARVGDGLVVGEDRIDEVVEAPSADSSPPYIIRWLEGGHIAMVPPDQHSRVIPAEETVTGGSGAAA